MSEDLKSKRERVLLASEKAVDELIKVLEHPIVTTGEDDLSADKMKNAASAKKLALLDALEMLDTIESERDKSDAVQVKIIDTSSKGFAEIAAKKNGR
jgi:hypothetical protein